MMLAEVGLEEKSPLCNFLGGVCFFGGHFDACWVELVGLKGKFVAHGVELVPL
jgi:hypothetical protein